MASKKVTFQMDAAQATKARDFLAFVLSRRTPEDWSRQKTAARKMLQQLDTALRIEVGPRAKRAVNLRPKKAVSKKKTTAKRPAKKTAARRR